MNEEIRIMEKTMLQYYNETMKEEQENDIFRSHYDFGKDYLLKIIGYRNRKLISKSEYNRMRNSIEELFLFY